MRVENIERLSDLKISRFNVNYLHYTPFMRDLSGAISKYATGKTVDIGCGNKPYEQLFENKITEYVGCDIIQSSLNKVDVLCAANEIPLPDVAFDTVFSTQTIEHVEDHQGLVNEAFRLIKPGGYFILSGPMYWYLHEQPYDFFRLTKYGFTYVLEKAGFEVVEILPNGGAWATAGQAMLHGFAFQNPDTGWFIKFMKKTFFRLRFHYLVNVWFSWLDKKDYNPINPMNYVVIAKKN